MTWSIFLYIYLLSVHLLWHVCVKVFGSFLKSSCLGFFCLFLFKVYFTRKYFYASNHIMINLSIRQLIIFTWYLSTLIAKKWRKVTRAKILESAFFNLKTCNQSNIESYRPDNQIHPGPGHASLCQSFTLSSRSAPCLTWLVCNNSATASCFP